MRFVVYILALAGVAFTEQAEGATFVVTNESDSGHGSLPWAWEAAHTNPGADTIAFNISTGGFHSISLTQSLETADPVHVDGWTQPGFAGRPLIEIRGPGLGMVPSYGFRFGGRSNLLRGVIVNNFATAVSFESSSGENTVRGCWIGLQSNGASAPGSGAYGVYVGCHDNIIGGTNATDRNVIAGHINDGIRLYYSFRNVIQGNYIGTDATGSNTVGNGYNINGTANVSAGIFIEGGGSNLIGGAVAGAGNLISGNVRGIALYSSTRGNVIQGNLIGPDSSGQALPSGTYQLYGIESISSYDNVIGGTNSLMRNVISGNGKPNDAFWGDGIFLSAVTGHVIRGNFIGSDITGTQSLMNLKHGINIQNGASGNTIGGTMGGAGNLVSGNGVLGIQLYYGHRNTIQGNAIGTQSDRTSAMGNAYGGIGISGGRGNLIGGTAAGAGNVIAYSVNGDGVEIGGTGSDAFTTNTVQRNSIFDNAGYGIRLFNINCLSCAPFNDSGDGDQGPNQLLNFPVLQEAVVDATSINITGTYNSVANSAITLEFYASPTVDSSGFGEGKTYLGNFTGQTDGSGNFDFDTYLPVTGISGQYITAIAVDANGNSSEFSAAIVAGGGGVGTFVFESGSSQVDEAAEYATLGVNRIAGSSGAASVSYQFSGGTAMPGSDFVLTNGVLDFADGETSKVITVSIINDTVSEITETVLATLTDPTGGAQLASPTNHVLSITDNDPIYVSAFDAAVTKPASGGTNLALRVTLSAAPVGPVTAKVNYATANLTATAGTDYLSASGTLTFANGSTQQFVQVAVLSDGLQEGSKSLQLVLSSPVNAVLADSTGLATIYDGRQGVLQFATSMWSVAEQAGSITVTVVRMGGTLGVVSVPFAANDGSATAPADFILTNGILSFANGVSGRTFAIQMNDDSVIEGPETISLVLGLPTGTTLGNPDGAYLMVADDEPLPGLQISSASNAVRLNWSTNAYVFQLHAATSLVDSLWMPVTNTPAVNTGQFEIVDPASTSRFYRLAR